MFMRKRVATERLAQRASVQAERLAGQATVAGQQLKVTGARAMLKSRRTMAVAAGFIARHPFWTVIAVFAFGYALRARRGIGG